MQWSKIGLVKDAVNLSKKKNFIIKLLHAHLQYVCNIPSKYQKDTVKALGGVNFIKYAPLTIIKYVQWSTIGLVKNTVKGYLHLCPRMDFLQALHINNSLYTNYENVFIELDS